MSTSAIKTAVEAIMTPYLEENGFELVDIEYVKEGSNWFLRIFCDREGGIDIDECVRISEYASEQLDIHEPISGAYFLEVSSPGAERPLKKPEDVQKAIGKNVLVTTYEPINKMKEFEGQLLAFNGEELTVRVGNHDYTLPYAKVASARLAIIF